MKCMYCLQFLQIRAVWKLKMGVSLLNLVAKGKMASCSVFFSAPEDGRLFDKDFLKAEHRS